MARKFLATLLLSLQLLALSVPFYAQEREQSAKDKDVAQPAQIPAEEDEGDDPDLPAGVKIDKSLYKQLRNEHVSMLRGLPYPKADVRNEAIYEMMRQENRLRATTGEADAAPNVAWQPIGPAPIPNGQTQGRTDPVSGRVSSIAVHPTNPNILYVGTAQGGLYRSLDGGNVWTPLLDNALSLSIGAVAIAPSDPTIVYVGTGEPGFSLDSFFGVGIYRITNADSPNPTVAGPLNAGSAGGDVFTGRSISEIIVHPTNANIIFASTVTGVGGLGGNQPVGAPALGLYRSNNALAGTPTFEKLAIQGTAAASRSVIDLAIEPGNPNYLLAAVVGNGGDGGVYLSTNALDAVPTFTRTLTTGDGAELGRAELAVNKTGSTITVIVASGTGSGTIYKSTDGGLTFPQSIDNNFCSGQCFYDIAVAIDPTDANKVYIGGSPTIPFARATDGTLNFLTSQTGLHVDTHAIAVAPSNTNTIYFGSDGGVWKSIDGGTNWTSQNTSTLSSMQYQSISLHPTDRYFSIGGTQDNGTHFLRPNNSWVRATGGDGGQSAIDQNAVDTTNVTGYHTFFNRTNTQIGYQRISTFNPNGTTQAGTFRGCTGAGTQTGINCVDPVLFYAPLTRGPGNPNTTYIGTDKVYRSANRGDLHEIVSQTFPARVSAIGIANNNDNIRLAGLTNGQVFVSTTGGTTMTEITGAVSPRYVTRFAIDPSNNNIAYVALGGFGLAAGQHIYKTTNLLSGAPTWTASGTGIPDVPVNAMVIDPANTNNVYAGSDIGVYRSVDAGASWQPFSDGLPRVAVFDMALQNANRFIRIATHGRGIYEISLNPATARTRADFDGDGKTDFSVFRAGNWYVQRSQNNSFQATSWGNATDQIAPGDFDGDGKADFVVYRPSAGSTFFVLLSSNNTLRSISWGVNGDIPRVGDYDGDGTSDAAIYRPSNNAYYVLPSNGGAFTFFQFGQSGDVSVVFDYDGDAKTDFGAFRPSNGTWYVRQSSNNAVVSVQFGQAGDALVPADYDNDNKEDVAVFRNGSWFALRSTNGTLFTASFGQAGDVPVPGDYDGDGADDVAVFRNGAWYAQRSTAGVTSFAFGQSGDVPVPAGYIP